MNKADFFNINKVNGKIHIWIGRNNALFVAIGLRQFEGLSNGLYFSIDGSPTEWRIDKTGIMPVKRENRLTQD